MISESRECDQARACATRDTVPLSIPRFELIGALIGLRLSRQVCSALEIEMTSVTYWVDNLNFRFWIRGQSREFKPFVAHRVGEIHDNSNPDQWRYVPTHQPTLEPEGSLTRADREYKMVERPRVPVLPRSRVAKLQIFQTVRRSHESGQSAAEKY